MELNFFVWQNDLCYVRILCFSSIKKQTATVVSSYRTFAHPQECHIGDIFYERESRKILRIFRGVQKQFVRVVYIFGHLVQADSLGRKSTDKWTSDGTIYCYCYHCQW